MATGDDSVTEEIVRPSIVTAEEVQAIIGIILGIKPSEITKWIVIGSTGTQMLSVSSTGEALTKNNVMRMIQGLPAS